MEQNILFSSLAFVFLYGHLVCNQGQPGGMIYKDYLLPREGAAAAENTVVGREDVTSIWDKHVMVEGCVAYRGRTCCHWNEESDSAPNLLNCNDKSNKFNHQIHFY